MSAAERKSKKIYYTMGEVSEMFDVNPSLIRFWEQKFDILKPDKNKKGNRLFTPADIENLKLIYHLVKENGMTLAGSQKRIKQNREGLGRDLEIVDRLQRIRAMLLEVRQELKGADENVVEIFVDHPSVPAEEHEAGGFPLSGILSETGVAAGDRNREEAGTEGSRASAAVAAGCAVSEWSDTPGPSVPFRLQELWPENEYPKSECALLAETGPAAGGEADDADAVAGSLEMADAVVETEVEMSGKPEAGAVDAVHETPPAEPVRPQVVEQTLF